MKSKSTCWDKNLKDLNKRCKGKTDKELKEEGITREKDCYIL